MRIIFLVIMLTLSGCQKDEESALKNLPLPQKVAHTEEDLELDKQNFVFVPNVPGIKIEGENISADGPLMSAENLRIYDSQDKLLDDFSLFDWGRVEFKTEGSFLKVYPVKDVLQVVYETSEKGPVSRKSSCAFVTRPDAAKFEALITEAKGEKPDWESVFSGLGELAARGDKRSAEFFLSPDASQLRMHKLSAGGDALELTIKVLRFMKKEGCHW